MTRCHDKDVRQFAHRWCLLVLLCVGVADVRLYAQSPPRIEIPTEAAPQTVVVPAPSGGEGIASAEPTAQPTRPQYQFDITLDPCRNHVSVRQIVKWQNPGTVPTNELVFHVYPRHRPEGKLLKVYERTVESLRLDPEVSIDKEGRRLRIGSIKSGETELAYCFETEHDTIMHVTLPAPVQPGETIEVALDYCLHIPQVQGRFGRYEEVINLLNWYPVLAVFEDGCWDAPPFLGWHQPWLVEAGDYSVSFHAPANWYIAANGQTVQETLDDKGWQHLVIQAIGLRDFAVVASPRFQLYETQVGKTKVQVVAFAEHQFHARIAVQTAVECIALYEQWFGPYPHPEFKIVESFFGWNGNETSGMVLIDGRVFRAPTAAFAYVDALVSHEICHQWWYSTVGTDGYREPWMDEGLVSYFTELRVKQKYGPDAKLINYPPHLNWLPNVSRDTISQVGYYIFRGRGGKGKAGGTLKEMGHVHNLFFLAYARGSRVVGMIHQRLGDEQFFDFFRGLYAKYAFRIIRIADFQRELEAYTGHSWEQFFCDWLFSDRDCDWEVEDVEIEDCGQNYRVTATLRQHGEITEPVELGYHFDDDCNTQHKLLINPFLGDYNTGNVAVCKVSDQTWTATFHTTQQPKQIELDPDQRILDIRLTNNLWRRHPTFRLTPIYTPLNEIDITRAMNRATFEAGPGVDIEGRLGLRGSLIVPTKYRISPFLAFTWDESDNQLTAGIEGIYFNLPAPKWDVGVRYEQTLASDLFDDPDQQGTVFLRRNLAYTTSYLYPNNSFLEGFYRFGDNFFPDESVRPQRDPTIEDYRDIHAVGLRYHLDSKLPYWDPSRGITFDATYEHGFRAFDEGESFNRVWSQLSGVRRLPDGLGYWSRTKLAGRVAGGIGGPDNGEHFRLGGARGFRGQRSEDSEGSRYWLTSIEWRLPIWENLDISLYDNFAGLDGITATVFYDVGEMHIQERSLGVDHAVGAGLYFVMPLLSFVENLTVRLEWGHSLENDTDVLWLGWFNAF